jgi:hypothetical protein
LAQRWTVISRSGSRSRPRNTDYYVRVLDGLVTYWLFYNQSAARIILFEMKYKL